LWLKIREIPEALMTKLKNPLDPVEVTLSLNVQTAWYLDRLVEKGLYGNNRADAAAVVLYDHCKLLIAQGELGKVPPIAGSAAIPIAQSPTPTSAP
jgi:hypothetical protein